MHPRIVTIAALFALTACRDSNPAAGIRGVQRQPPAPKPDFTLQSADGRPFHFAADTRGSVTLLYFGYTYCPDVCPAQLGNIAAALKRLPADVQSKVRVVFVTTDPERDTPERLRDWLKNFDARFIGLRGDPAEVNRIAMSLGLPPSQIEPMDPKMGVMHNYGVGHGAQVLAFSPDDSLHYEYPAGFTQDDWANDLPRLTRIGHK
jgi:protein SCO1